MNEKSGKMGTPVRKKLSYDEQAVFCRQMAYIAKAGIPLADACELLGAEGGNEDIINHVFSAVRGGSSFSSALKETGCFSDYLTSVVKLGEKTGNIEQTFYELTDYFEQHAEIRRRIRQAFIYPLILFIMMLAVILFLIIEVLPQFAEIISGSGGTLPSMAGAILGFGLWVRADYPYILSILAVVIAAAALFLRSNAGRRVRDRFMFTRAGFGSTTRKLVTARLCAAMKMALASGSGFSDSLGLATEVIGSCEVRRLLLQAKGRIEAGGDILQALGGTGLFPQSFLNLLATAYKTGNLEETLGRMSSYYQNDFDEAVYSITSRIEPALVIVLSCVAGIILFSVMLPIINIMQLIS